MDSPLTPFSAPTSADPYDYYRDLAVQRPFYWDQDIKAWVASDARWVAWALHEADLGVRPLDEPVPKALGDSALADLFSRLARMNDGGRHECRRAMVAAAAQASSPHALLPFAQAAANALALAFQQGRLSLASYCHDTPIMAMSGLLGLSQVDQARACALIPAIVAGMAPGASGIAIEQGANGAAELMDTMGRVFASAPHDDLIGALRVHAQSHPGLSREDACANAIGLLIQTYEATAGLVGNTLLALERHRQWLAPFMKDDSMSARIIAEVLRWDPSIHNTRRFAHTPLTAGTHRIATGDLIVVMLAASNRDPAQMQNPERFDPSRQAPSNTLGQGRHACVGGSWAALIAQCAVRSLLDTGFALDHIDRPIQFRTVKNARVPELRVRAVQL